MKLSGSLLRVSVLLFVVSFTGLLGLNGSLDPTRVQSVKAAALDIDLTSNGFGTLQFQLAPATDCWDYLAPGDACFAEVLVENVGDQTAELSQPEIVSVSGGLQTCEGGPNLDVTLEDISYTNEPGEGYNLIDPGETETFEVHFALADVGNACQGQTATIVVRVLIGLAPEDPTPTPQATATPTATPGLGVDTNFPGTGNNNPPVNEIGGTRTTPVPGATRTNEVLPTRLPVTGTGWTPTGGGLSALEVLFLGAGALSLATLALAIATRRQKGDLR
jgi:hypothetical protein